MIFNFVVETKKKNKTTTKKQKRSLPFIWTENASVETKNCVVVLSMMVSIIFVSLVWQVWPSLSY